MDKSVYGLMGVAIGMGLVMVVWIISSPDLGISQDTADDICKQLTGNELAVAITRHNKDYCSWRSECKLICEIPNSIIIRSNSEK